jgi:hypothetical protein
MFQCPNGTASFHVIIYTAIVGRDSLSGRDFWLLGTSALTALKNSKIIFMSFKKYMKKNLDVDKDLSHRRAKYQFRILCSFGYTKMTSVWI